MNRERRDTDEAPEGGEPNSEQRLIRRRAVIAAASGLVAAALAKSAAQPGEAQAAGDTGDFLLGTTNKTQTTTELDRTGSGHDPALFVFNGEGAGVVGQSPLSAQQGAAGLSGVGVLGATGDIVLRDGVDYYLTLSAGVVGVVKVPTPVALQGVLDVAAGVRGHSQSSTGTIGSSDKRVGVLGLGGVVPQVLLTETAGIVGVSDGIAGTVGIGVSDGGRGASTIVIDGSGDNPTESVTVHSDGDGVLGLYIRRKRGAGVHGIASKNEGEGVKAVNLDGGVALAVHGRARFSTAGRAVIKAILIGSDEYRVANPAVTGNSHVTVTFLGDPGAVQVSWVELQPGAGFTLHLSGAPKTDIPFSYLVVEFPPAAAVST
jgi:hypothetical protein